MSHKKQSRYAQLPRAIAGGVALTLSLAACGSAAPSSPATAGSSKKGSAKKTSTSSVLTISGSTNTVLDLNPFNGDTGVDAMYNTLELVNPVNGHFTPELATAFKATNSKTLVFTIRKGVKWSNGTAFTPADVVFTFNLIKKYPALDSGGVWSQLSSVAAVGNSVVFKLKVPDVPLGLSLAQVPIVSQAVWSKVANPVKYTASHPVVTGPYSLGSYAPTKLVLKKNPTSFEANQVRPGSVAFVAAPTNHSAAAILIASGRYDFAYAYIPDVQKAFVARNPAHNVYWFPPGGVVSLYFNLTQAPFNNAYFRQGVSYALDRRAIENKAVFGVENVAPQTGLILPGQRAWQDPSIPNSGLITMNRATAKADFKKAGFTEKGGKLIGANGKQLSFAITVPNSYSDWVSAARQIATNLGQVGISVTLKEPTSAIYANQTQAGEFQAAVGSFGGSGSPYSAFNPALNGAFAAPIKTPTVNNFERFQSRSVNQDLAALARATTKKEQLKATYALEQVMYKQVPIVEMYYGGMWGLFSTRRWVGWPSAKNPYTLPATWNSDLLAILMHVTPA